jgi:hypothetical protein
MVDWNPREEMSPLRYLKFKLRRWTRVSTVPKWVHEAGKEYYNGYQEKHGNRPYDVEKVFTGDSLRYRIYYKAVSQGKIEPVYYVRIK